MDFLILYFNKIGYLGILIALFLCGLGVPIPEDIIIITGGYLAYLGRIHLPQTLIVCFVGVLTGDLTIYLIGRYWGNKLIKKKFAKKVFTDVRLNKALSFFINYGGKAIFITRFLPGIRSATYLVAGIVKMNIIKFLLIDLLAALLSVPLFLFLAYHFGSEIDSIILFIKKIRHVIFIILAAFIVFLYFKYKTKKRRKLI